MTSNFTSVINHTEKAQLNNYFVEEEEKKP